MKIDICKTILFTFILLIGINAFSQPLKGRFVLGSGITFNLEGLRNGDTLGGAIRSSSSIGLSPMLSYLISNRFSVGVTSVFVYGTGKQNSRNNLSGSGIATEARNITYGAGLIARYYLPIFSEKFGLNLQGVISYQHQYYEGYGGSSTWSIYSKSDNFYFTLTPVIYYFPHPRVELNLSSLSLQAYYESKTNPSIPNGNYNQRYGLDLQYPTGIAFTLLYHIGK